MHRTLQRRWLQLRRSTPMFCVRSGPGPGRQVTGMARGGVRVRTFSSAQPLEEPLEPRDWDARRLALDTALGSLPLFMPSMTVFPGQNCPLNIFEPRYQVMVDHVLRGGRMFGIGGERACSVLRPQPDRQQNCTVSHPPANYAYVRTAMRAHVYVWCCQAVYTTEWKAAAPLALYLRSRISGGKGRAP
jgi:hypothetical protein